MIRRRAARETAGRSGHRRGGPTGDGLRVLVVSAQFPYPPRFGFATRVYELARRLRQDHGHDVTLLAYAGPEELAAVAPLQRELRVEAVPRPVRGLAAKRAAQLASLASPTPFAVRALDLAALQARLDDLAARQRFDVVQLESSLLGALRLPAGTPAVIDSHNVEHEVFARLRQSERSLGRRLFGRLEERRCRHHEHAAWRRAAACAVTSEREVAMVLAAAPSTPTAVVPNGVDLERFAATPYAPAQPTVVFNGTLLYRPNVDAARHLADDVWPRVRAARPDARLVIVGRGDDRELGRLRAAGATVTGEVADVRPYLGGAAVIAVPVRTGGGTRLKVVEGLAMARPMVSTTLGCEGIDVRDGEHLLVRDGAVPFADAIVRLLGDRSLAERLARAGRARMEERYSWDAAAARLDGLLRGVAGAPRSALTATRATAEVR